MTRPYKDLEITDQYIIREFDENIDPIELLWHRDDEDRTIDAKYRDSIDNAIKLMLNEWPPVKLIEIKGTTEERIETIKGALFS